MTRRRDDGPDNRDDREQYDDVEYGRHLEAAERQTRRRAFKDDFAADFVNDQDEMRKLFKEAFKEWCTETVKDSLSKGMIYLLKALGFVVVATIIVIILWAMGWKPPTPGSMPPIPPILK